MNDQARFFGWSQPGPLSEYMLTISERHRPFGHQIRVLDLLPGSRSDAICCQIRIIDLKSDEKYEALSYVWGDRAEEAHIDVSGDSFAVTRNLHAALARLRDVQERRTLWIDQICIEQANNEERGRQVSMMRDIYRNCSCCVIWLGELDQYGESLAVKDAQAVLDFINFAADADSTTRSSELPVLFEDNDNGAYARKAFVAFAMYGNPWWSRVWTIQEAIIPSSAIFHWGPLTLPQASLFLAVENLHVNNMRNFFSHSFQRRREHLTPLLRRILYP
ncbi:MAG: HET domain-containing protein, partial [Oxalobacteraceae bacterium]